MLNSFSPFMVPLFAAGLLSGCGGEQTAHLRQPLTETKDAEINQADIDDAIDDLRLRDCTFVVAGGIATFTPSSELSQLLYGDPDGSAHQTTFPVPPINTGSATIEIRNMSADFGASTLSLSGETATLRLAFSGLSHLGIELPFFGRLSADVEIRPSTLAAELRYDRASARLRVSRVVSRINHVTRNCGGNGWCNGLLDGILRANLATWIEAPLRTALNNVLDDPDRTQDLNNLLVALYNRKDPQMTPWEMVQGTLELASDVFSFEVERELP